MSYILDALKKSEYARQQGKVPDLATLPAVDTLANAPSAFARLPLLASGALLLAVAVAGWWRPWQAPAAPLPSSPATAASLSTTTVVSSPATALASAQASKAAPPSASPGATAAPPSIPAAAPVAAAQPETPPLATPPQAQAQPVSPVAAIAQAVPKVVLPALAPQPGTPKTLPAAAPATLAATPRPSSAPASALPAPPSRVLAFYELPPAVRERIPALAISGFSYVEEPGMRMAVINDRVLRQGESAAPGITLERIASDGVVLNFSGYRFRPQR
ncbi:general secretion pathway protein B [Geopseudomonas sagittaria]|uniref:General secretion pathway protein B n=1 Tax=Geopseudomonas sagittaria TaxID=1135990 RepID=A0A1I5Q2Z2_9GAMM|nr:general secretion pathway protein GspB [Pseudomonas sagittaria]SFP40569.1 general secretion pathway protein B [Pseudomonas sagittaria]